jgi:hypothetical protein
MKAFLSSLKNRLFGAVTARMSVRRAALASVLMLAAVSVLATVLWRGSEPVAAQSRRPRPVRRNNITAPDADKAVTSGEQTTPLNREIDGDRLLQQEGFWMQRMTYPTGRFNAAWVREAAIQDAQISRGVPNGRKRVSLDLLRQINGSSILAPTATLLNTSSFTALGPSPEAMTGCTGCFDYGKTQGRVNSIAIDPTTTTNGSIVAYIATVGGGVWKTISCCSASTTWSVTTDDPAVSTTTIDSVTIDPNDHNTIYAGTGDLNYGSFSMGSQGILKSTNGGATWQTLGANVFGAALPEPAGQFPQYQAVGKVRVDPNNSNNVVAGTKTGLYFSYDGGSNWTGPCITSAFGAQRQDITGLELTNIGGLTRILAAVGTRGFATPVQYNLDQNGANGLYRGTMPASGCPSDFTLLTRNNNGFIFGANVTGSPYSTGQNLNAGTGTPYGGVGTGNQLGRMDIAVAPSDPNYIYAQVGSIAANSNSGCGNGAGCQLGVWASTDGGVTWSFMAGSAGGSLSDCTNTAGDYPQNWYDQGLAVDPNNPDRVYVDTFDTWLASRTGTSFYDVTCGYNGSPVANHVVHVDHHALAFVNGSSSILLEGSDGGIFSTSNADAAVSGGTRPTWVNMDNGLYTIEFYFGDISGNFATSTSPMAAGGAQDNGPSSVTFAGSPTGPVQWQMGLGGDGFNARIDPVGTGTSLRVWEGNNSGGVYRCISNCTSAGASWTLARGSWTSDTQSFVLPWDLFHGGIPGGDDCGPASSATGCGHLVAGTTRVYETVSGANTFFTPAFWYITNNPSTQNMTKATLGNRSYINQVKYSPKFQSVAILGTNDANVWIGFNLGTGVAGQANWVNVTGGNSVLPNRPVLGIALDPTVATSDVPVGYAAVGGFDQNTPSTPGHLFRVACSSGCASITWTDKSGNLPNIPVDSVIVNPNFPQQVFAGTDFGLYYTDNINVASPTWTRFTAGVPSVMIWDMQIDRGSTTLSLWTRGRGAFVWPLPLGPVGPLATSSAVTSASGVYGGTATLTATLTQGGSPVSGKTITFSLNGNPVGAAGTNASGVATLSGVPLPGYNAGSYPSAVAASFGGDSTYALSSGYGNLTVNQATSATNVDCPSSSPYTGSPRTPCSASYTTSDTLSGSLPVSYSNNTDKGTATASATYPGDGNHANSSDSKNFQILGTTAANVSVSGRVLSSSGSGIRGARVTITAANGSVLLAVTNAFGYYSFASVTAGRTYTIAAGARGFAVSPKVVLVNDELRALDLIASP